jgi:pimeloyl-ACP methyl ester carboxylesterase
LSEITFLFILVLLASLPASAQAPPSPPAAAKWVDPSPHDVRFVTADEGVRLEVLDWGGSGRPIVLLAGSGNSAHVFDEFAPKLTDCCHVYAITRRGFGASSQPSGGYDDQRLADDVWRVIELLKIEAPVLVGHSMAGAEMSTVGRRHSDRLAGLVYLDAIGDIANDPPADPEWAALRAQLPGGLMPPPVCRPEDRRTFAAYRSSMACRWNVTLPESELRSTMVTELDGSVGPPRTDSSILRAIGQQQIPRDYTNIRVPVVAMFAFFRSSSKDLRPDEYQPTNDAERAAIDRFMARMKTIADKWSAKLTASVPGARFVDLPGAGHYVFLTRGPEVLREIHLFVDSLPRPPK